MIKKQDYTLLTSFLRRAFSRSSFVQSLKASRKSPDKRGPRGGSLYICDLCGKSVSLSKINVDHIDPVIPIGYTSYDLNIYKLLDRIWCDPKNLQIICVECHNKKSKAEARLRKQIKNDHTRLSKISGIYRSFSTKFFWGNRDPSWNRIGKWRSLRRDQEKDS